MQSIAGEELSSRIKTLTRDVGVRHTARPDDDMGSVLHEVRNNLGRVRHGQCDFDDGNSLTCDRLGSKKGILLRIDANGGDDSGLLDPAPHLVFLHLIVSFLCKEKRQSTEGTTRPRRFSVHRLFSIAKVSMPGSFASWQRR